MQSLGLLPIVSAVHWSFDFQPLLDKFKKKHKGEDKNWEYLLISETEFPVMEY